MTPDVVHTIRFFASLAALFCLYQAHRPSMMGTRTRTRTEFLFVAMVLTAGLLATEDWSQW